MPFDGVAVRALALELKKSILDSRIDRISMPSKDEIVLVIRSFNGTKRLVISMNPSSSAVYLTGESFTNPPSPPNFCMFLRKHIGGGIIREIQTYGYERYFSLTIDSRSALGDTVGKTLMIELTGRNCNTILINNTGFILESLRHIDSSLSRVREIMPARKYIFIPSQNKIPPDSADPSDVFTDRDVPVEKLILSKVQGFSPVLCREVCSRAGVVPGKTIAMMTPGESNRLHDELGCLLDDIKAGRLHPCVAFHSDGRYRDFHCQKLTVYDTLREHTDFNDAVCEFFLDKRNNVKTNLGKSDLVKAVSKNIARCRKKVEIHANIIDSERAAEEYKLYGELITANIHNIKPGAEEVTVLNYYTGEDIKVPLDSNKDAVWNAQKYFKKFKKVKSAVANSRVQLKKAAMELDYLESVEHCLFEVSTPEETKEIRRELSAQGYIRKKHTKYRKKEEAGKFRPHAYISSEGYEIYAGRNNNENDYLTFKFASKTDLWLHAKGIPGSHVIIRKKDHTEDFFPDLAISEAAVIAVYHSKAGGSGKTAVDYSLVRNIKKPGGAKPGMVNYFEYFSAYATPDEILVNKLRRQ